MLFSLALAITHTIGVFQTCKSLGDPVPDQISGCKVDYRSAFGKNLEIGYAAVAGAWGLWVLWVGVKRGSGDFNYRKTLCMET